MALYYNISSSRKNPNFRVYPIFRFFESWCQDENRHGDFFAALLKSQQHLLNTFESRLWCRFFLLSVFVTMYLNDLQRTDFYSTIGLDSKQFDLHVIKKTNQSSGTLFPVILDVDHPDFVRLLDQCATANQNLIDIEKQDNLEIVKIAQKLPNYFSMATGLIGLYLLPVIETKYIWTEKEVFRSSAQGGNNSDLKKEQEKGVELLIMNYDPTTGKKL